MHLRCLESKKRSPRTILRPPSPQSPCPLPSIRPAAASTVSVCLVGCCTLVPAFSCPRVAAVAITQGGAIQLANNGTDSVQGLQTLTMANTAAAQPGATILQYAQTSDGQQILVPSNQVVVQGGRISSILCPLRVCEVSDFHARAFCLPQPPPAMSRPIRSAQPPPAPSLPGWSWPLRRHWVQAESPKRSRAKGKSGL